MGSEVVGARLLDPAGSRGGVARQRVGKHTSAAPRQHLGNCVNTTASYFAHMDSWLKSLANWEYSDLALRYA